MTRLAINGGRPALSTMPARRNPVGHPEKMAANRVLDSGTLSKFVGIWTDDFYGGPEVRDLESEWSDVFGVSHSVSFNSWTSGLIAAVGAIGVEPGDEVITTPYTMSACATAILHWNAIPVFADIEPLFFCIDPDDVERKISDRTRAILAVDIFGHPSDSARLLEIGAKYGVAVLTDSAQAPGARDQQAFAGTLTDAGGFSMNFHKHISAGEGGILVSNRPEIAERAALVRNHGESVLGGPVPENEKNRFGYNLRMGEIEAAIIRSQLPRLNGLVSEIRDSAAFLAQKLGDLPGLRLPQTRPGVEHAYYAFPMVLESKELQEKRARIAEALRAEGVPGVNEGYVNLHRLPIFENRRVYGNSGIPWSLSEREIPPYSCPVAELMFDRAELGLAFSDFLFDESDLDSVAQAFQKVWAEINTL